MTADKIAVKLARAFMNAGPASRPGKSFWISKPYGYPYAPAAVEEALGAMVKLATEFPAGPAGHELMVPLGATTSGAVWPWGEGWQLRVLFHYEMNDDSTRMRVDVRRVCADADDRSDRK